MFCVIASKPMITARIGTPGTPGSSGLLEPGDKWVQVQEHIISRAFATEAQCHCWAWKHGGIEEHDAGLVARGQWAEFDFFKEKGKFTLTKTSQYPNKTTLLLVDIGTRELPPEPAPKKSGENGWGWTDIAREQQAAAAREAEAAERLAWRQANRDLFPSEPF